MDKHNDGQPAAGLRRSPVDDLDSPLAAPLCLGEAGPYVINLCVANTPLPLPAATLLKFDHLHIYQVKRMEDGRLRYRLRIGPIMSELEADVILAAVRQHYPVALTATAGEADLRAIAIAAANATEVVHRTAKPSMAVPAELPGAGRDIARYPQPRPDPLPSVDSTQTLRALTPIELAEDQPSKWFAIQLAVADSGFHPQDVLNLDIFKEFSLYSTIGLDQGRVLHALRLGFFAESAAAHLVADYVRRYFDASVVKRVSSAERERFAERRVIARKSSDATGVHEAIEMSTPALVPSTNLRMLSGTDTMRNRDGQSARLRGKPPLKR